MKQKSIEITIDSVTLNGDIVFPEDPVGLVLFVHGSGSGRHSPRNRFVANILNQKRIATLLFDLLTLEEEEFDSISGALRFNIPLLSERLILVTDWVLKNQELSNLKLGYFGASTGAAAALMAASKEDDKIDVIVSRGGRPDLAEGSLRKVRCPTLFIVGGRDDVVIDVNKEAIGKMICIKKLIIIPGATHLFEEEGKLEDVSHHASDWFLKYFGS
ncbi:MAG: dienelactone hydrolase family protein [Nitrososphaera sp.]|jgi:pimeloyl-ACP methyl ester carboxylesterase